MINPLLLLLLPFLLAIPLAAQTPSPPFITAPYSLDENGDALPDLWQAFYNLGNSSAFEDPDGDGVNNLNESRAGTNPLDPSDRLYLKIAPSSADRLTAKWPKLSLRTARLETTSSLLPPWTNASGTPVNTIDENGLLVTQAGDQQFFRVAVDRDDSDLDDVPDFIEGRLGFSTGSGNHDSAFSPVMVDLDDDGVAESPVSGDLRAFNEIYRPADRNTPPTQAQSGRFLLNASFGAADLGEIERVVSLGYEGWIDEQIALPPSYTLPYILAIKRDFNSGTNSPDLTGYNINSTFLGGSNFMSAWARSVIQGEDQLRQRVAFALSQIIVASSANAQTANQPQAIATYYDHFLRNAFGRYEDLLIETSLSPIMGHWLSHIGNRKADPAAGRFPDENFAREIMQLFTIGLFELNLDGSLRAHPDSTPGNFIPIPTYGNFEITEMARVFTGVNYAANRFGGGYRDDGDRNFMTTRMRIYPDEHDSGVKQIPFGADEEGNRIYRTSSQAASGSAEAEVEDVIRLLVRHPNTAPFVCRQLIQFLVTANPSPAYVARVASVFRGNGTTDVGDMEQVVKAILLDDEALSPMEHLATQHFGGLREPVIRSMHVARIGNMDRHQNLLWWDWGQHREATLQEPMHAPSVFNFYRPDFRLPGEIAQRALDSPVFGITNSYSSIAVANRLWSYIDRGFRLGSRYSLDTDFTELEQLASDIPSLLDHLSILICGGTLSASSRSTISTALLATNDLEERAKLAVFAVIMSPEGANKK